MSASKSNTVHSYGTPHFYTLDHSFQDDIGLNHLRVGREIIVEKRYSILEIVTDLRDIKVLMDRLAHIRG